MTAPTGKEFSRFLRIFAVLVLTTVPGIAFINLAVDPLWHAGGNHLFPENYVFNERHAKTVRYMKSPEKWNCILFGSSRVTLFDERMVTTHDCFNFSFSDGNPREFVAYARYIEKYGTPPDLIIIGVDARILSRNRLDLVVPEFVHELLRPPSFLRDYVSWNSLEFTLRTLIRKSPRRRYYDGDLVGNILPGTRPYTPPRCYSRLGYGQAFHLKHMHHYLAIKSIFPDARIVGYVAPIAAWDMSLLVQDGSLGSYIDSMYILSGHFDEFYDFSVVSPVTLTPELTYDGHHYDRATNHKMARQMFHNQPGFGIPVHELSHTEYRNRFGKPLLDYVARTRPKLVFDDVCGRWHPLR